MANIPSILTRTIIEGQIHNQEFTGGKVRIGRLEDNDLVIAVHGVSGHHATLEIIDGSLILTDLGSTNGTFVNGERLSEPVTITSHDVITLGRTEMRAKIKSERRGTKQAPAPKPLAEESTPVDSVRPSAPQLSPIEEEEPDQKTVVNMKVPTALLDDNIQEVKKSEPAAPAAPVTPAASSQPVKSQPAATPLRQPEKAQVRPEPARPATVSSNKQPAKPALIGTDGERPSAQNKVLEVSLLWDGQLMLVNHYSTPKDIFIGDDAKNDFKVEAKEELGTERFPLLTADNGAFVLQITDQLDLQLKDAKGTVVGTTASLLQQGRLVKSALPAPKPVYRYNIGLDDWISITIGQMNFIIRYVAPAKWVPISVANTIDFYFSKVLAISLVVHLFLALALLFTPQLPEGLDNELFKESNRFADLIIAPPPVKKAKEDFKLEAKQEKIKQVVTQTTEREKFGKVEEKKVVASGKKGPGVDLDKRERDQKRALNSGIFSALKGSKGAASVFSGGGLGTGINNAVATLQGPSTEDVGGTGGLGSRGTGGAYGGGGLGIGGLGSGSGGGGLGGGGNVGLVGKERGGYSVAVGRAIVEGGLSKAEVAKVLQRAQSQIRYCYEKELQNKPDLYGKIVTVFKIGPNGRVIQSSISQSTMNDANVEKCVLQVISRLIFPNPRGGGAVDVNYPWIFKHSD